MYHLIANLSYSTPFIVIDDTTYRASDWSDCIPSQLDHTAHWNRDANKGKPIHEALFSPYTGKPIHEALFSPYTLLASSPQLDFHLKYTPTNFPEFFI